MSPPDGLATARGAVLGALQEDVAKASKDLEVARANRDKAQAAHAAAHEAFEAAKREYADVRRSGSEKDATAKASAFTRATLDATVCDDDLARAEHDAGEAEARNVAASNALTEAKRRDKIETLRAASSADEYHAQSKALQLKFISQIEALVATSDDIDAVFGRSIQASSELRAMGENVHDLDPLHVLLEALQALSARGVTIDRDVHAFRYACTPSREKGGRAIGTDLSNVVDAIVKALRRETPAPHAEELAQTLERYRATRTHYEQEALGQVQADLTNRLNMERQHRERSQAARR